MSTTLAREADALRAQIRALEQKFLPMPEQERNEIAAAQARADSVARQFGDVGATQPLPNETAIQFRKRLLGNYKKHSPAYRGANIEMIGDPSILAAAEDRIYADATKAAHDPANFKPFELRAIREPDESGRMVTKWVGDSMAWMQYFMTGAKIGKINRNPSKQ